MKSPQTTRHAPRARKITPSMLRRDYKKAEKAGKLPSFTLGQIKDLIDKLLAEP